MAILHKIQPWHLILLGIGLTIAAALLQHIYVERSFDRLENIRSEIAKIDSRIDGLWQQNIEAERKKEFAALLMPSNGEPNKPPKLIRNYLSTIVTEDVLETTKDLDTESILALINTHQLALREQIDDLYFDHISLAQKVAPIQKQVSQNKNIALLMQLLGLILVLSKDLARRDR